MRIIFLLSILFIISCNSGKKDHILIETGYGDIEVELYPAKAPVTVAAFVKNVNEGYYNNSTFYRVLKSEQFQSDNNTGILQGGIHHSGTTKKAYNIPHESTNRSGLSHTDGIISMARNEPGTASTEFFICIGDQSPLDSGRRGPPDGLGMAAFGKVVKGMKVVRKIHNEKSTGDSFVKPIPIRKIKLL